MILEFYVDNDDTKDVLREGVKNTFLLRKCPQKGGGGVYPLPTIRIGGIYLNCKRFRVN